MVSFSLTLLGVSLLLLSFTTAAAAGGGGGGGGGGGDVGTDVVPKRLSGAVPLLMPESHLGTTTPWAENHVIVTMYSSESSIYYKIDDPSPFHFDFSQKNEGEGDEEKENDDDDEALLRRTGERGSKYLGEVTISEPGTHTVRAVSVDENTGAFSEEATAVYKVAAVARGTAYDGYLDHCLVGWDLDADLEIDDDNEQVSKSSVTYLDISLRAWYKLTTLKSLSSGYVLLKPDPPTSCVCGVPKPSCCCDRSVGITQMLYLRTPANATQLNPVTTFLSQLIELSSTSSTTLSGEGERLQLLQVQELENLMKEVWQLPARYDVIQDDILWLTLHSHLDVHHKGPRALVRMAQAEVLACCIAMTLAGTRNQTWPDDKIATAVYSSVANITLNRGGIFGSGGRRRMNFSDPETTREVTLGAASLLGLGSGSGSGLSVDSSSSSPSTLSSASLDATAAIVSKLCLALVSLLDIHEETRDIQKFSLPVEIAAVSREANTKIGQDLNLVALSKLSLEAFEDLHLKEDSPSLPGEEGIYPPPTSDRSGDTDADADADADAEEGTLGDFAVGSRAGGILNTWQIYLLGFGGAPALIVVLILFVKRRRHSRSEKLLNLMERHNLLNENDSHNSQGGQWEEEERGDFGDLELQQLGSTGTSTSLPAPPPSPSEAYRDPAFDHSDMSNTAGGDSMVGVAEMDAFGSPQKIRHRPPKSYAKQQSLERQTLVFDQKRQTWHMPLEPPKKKKGELASVGESHLTASSHHQSKAQQVLHAIAEGEGEAKPKARSKTAKVSPAPPPVTSKTFIRRTKLYEG